MIYYFSGTGNSQWVAEQLAKRTQDTALFIPQVIKDMQKDLTFGPDDVVGVVFPVYAWAAPEIVMQFLQHVHVDEKTFTFAVCTCGSEAGRTFDQFKTVFPLKSAYTVSMPDNCITLFDLDRPELIREKLNVAQQRMPIIAMNISTRRTIFEIEEGTAASFKTKVINPLFALSMMTTRRFSVDKSCTGCGQCEKNCPFGTIKMQDGKPVWNGRCQQCMSCIMRCPVQAIQCGAGTRKRRRYVNPNEPVAPAVGMQAAQTRVTSIHNLIREQTMEQSVPQTQNQPMSDARQIFFASAGKTLPVDSSVDMTHTTSAVEKTAIDGLQNNVEFIAQKDIHVLTKDDLISRQLLSPLNSQAKRVALTEIHLHLGAVQERHVYASAEQIWYALRGTATLLLAEDKECAFVAGDVVRFAENAVHGIKNTGTDEFVYLSVTTPPVDFTSV